METDCNRREKNSFEDLDRLSGFPNDRRLKIERRNRGEGQVPANGTVILLRRLIRQRRMLVWTIGVVVMQVASHASMAVRAVRGMYVRVPPTSDH